MDGWIKIEDYRVHCTIGVHPFEQVEEQEIILDISLLTDFTKCIQSDSIADTIDYEDIGKICRDVARSKHYNLLETYVYVLINAIFTFSPEIKKACVKVKKQRGLPLATFTAIELEIERP